MDEAIRTFATQFAYEPELQHADVLKPHASFIVCGMGGSHLSAGLLKMYRPEIDLLIHRDYGLPRVPEYFLKQSLIILSSYSGNTEEVLDTGKCAREQGLAVVVLATGGKLVSYAKEHNVPLIELPQTGIQPRSALGFSLRALLKITGEAEGYSACGTLASSLDPALYEDEGKKLAHALQGLIPLVYASSSNLALAYNWKIKFNETGKIPSFYNVFPELNHNEMTGFDVAENTRSFSEKFAVLLLMDDTDHPQVQKRMRVLKKLYQDREIKVMEIPIVGTDVFLRMFSSLVLADWTAYHTARQYGLEAEQVPMVEEFKKLISL